MSGRRVTIVASEILGAPRSGGPAAADSLLAVAVARHGHRVELLVAPGRPVAEPSPEWQRRYDGAGVSVQPLGERRRVEPRFLAAPAAVFDALRADPPDVVVADDWRGLAYLALNARRVGVACAETAFVLYCHAPGRALTESAGKVPDTLDRFGEDVAERACFELADAVVSPSHWLLDWLRSHDWPVPDAARVVPHLWQSVALGEDAVQAKTPATPRRLAFFGQFREGKGIRLYVSALRQLDPGLLLGRELLFLGRETPRWTAAAIRAALGEELKSRLAGVRFESELDRSAALAELLAPGTLAVMPSLAENSPYAIAECLEHGIPFVAARVGGIPELVSSEDHERVLFEPSAAALAETLTRALASDDGFGAARPARPGTASLEAWLELIDTVSPPPRAQQRAATRVAIVARGEQAARRAERLQAAEGVQVEVVPAASRERALDRTDAGWLLFLDEDDDVDDGLIRALVDAQAASGCDVVTAAVRSGDGDIRFFLGDPRALGVVANHYGVVGLVRRSLLTGVHVHEGAVDPDWPLFATLATRGARIVSVPMTLSTHHGRVGTVADVPGEGNLVLAAFEAPGAAAPGLAQLAATLGAATVRLERERDLGGQPAGVVARGRRVVEHEGVAGLIRRVGDRLGPAPRRRD